MGKLNKGREEMNIWILVASIFLLSISWWFTFFQLSELKKKFKILQERLAKRDGVFGTLIYEGSFKTFKKSPHMRNIVIRSSNNFPYLLTGYLMFQNCGGADPFIVQRSDKFGITIISIYVGEGPAEILFEATGWGASKITVSSTERDQSEKPMIVVKPHWFQKPIFSGISSWVAKNILKI